MMDNQAKPNRGFGVVVLNYNDYHSTISCVRSLMACIPPPSYVVVVDNKSPNESLAVLRAELSGSENVEVVDSGSNGGYSFGNNVGIRRLQELGLKNVVIATSDTKVVSLNLFAELGSAMHRRVGAVAPQIIGPSALQNPSIEKLTAKYLIDLAWLQLGMPGFRLRRSVSRLLRRVLAAGQEQKQTPFAPTSRRIRKVYKLHGAFICLTEAFFERVGELDERIFMFGEEDLLAWKCLDNGLDQLLVEGVAVRHEDDSSVRLTWGAKAQSFVDTEQRKSCRILRQEINVAKLARTWITTTMRVRPVSPC